MPEQHGSEGADNATVAVVRHLHRAAAALRADLSRDHPLNEIQEGPFIRFGTARLLDTVAEALDHGQSLPQPVLDTAQQIAAHVLSNRPL